LDFDTSLALIFQIKRANDFQNDDFSIVKSVAL